MSRYNYITCFACYCLYVPQILYCIIMVSILPLSPHKKYPLYPSLTGGAHTSHFTVPREEEWQAAASPAGRHWGNSIQNITSLFHLPLYLSLQFYLILKPWWCNFHCKSTVTLFVLWTHRGRYCMTESAIAKTSLVGYCSRIYNLVNHTPGEQKWTWGSMQQIDGTASLVQPHLSRPRPGCSKCIHQASQG